MEFMIDKKGFKSKMALRVISFILISLCLLAFLAFLYYIFLKMIYIPIIISLLVVFILVILIFIFFVGSNKDKKLVYKLDGENLSTKNFNISLSKVYKLTVYSRKDKVYRIKLRTNLDSITIDKLSDDGLSKIIDKTMEVKNGKDI